MKMTLTMFFLFGVLLIAWNLQDAGQQLAGAVLMVISLAFAFVLQLEGKR